MSENTYGSSNYGYGNSLERVYSHQDALPVIDEGEMSHLMPSERCRTMYFPLNQLLAACDDAQPLDIPAWHAVEAPLPEKTYRDGRRVIMHAHLKELHEVPNAEPIEEIKGVHVLDFALPLIPFPKDKLVPVTVDDSFTLDLKPIQK